MVILIKIRNAGKGYFYHSFSVFNIKTGEPFNLDKVLFSSKREYLYEKDMEIEIKQHPELKKAARAIRYIGAPPAYIPTGVPIDFISESS
jgi:hypothetical protein